MKKNYETERLILRRFSVHDQEDYYAMLSDENVYVWLGSGKKVSYEDSAKIMAYFNKGFDEKGFGVYAVIEKESGKLIGQAGFNVVPPLDRTEYLYALSKSSWGKGYATEAGKALISYFENEHVDVPLIALTHQGNVQSKRVLDKLGFVEKGEKELFGLVLNYYEMFKSQQG